MATMRSCRLLQLAALFQKKSCAVPGFQVGCAVPHQSEVTRRSKIRSFPALHGKIASIGKIHDQEPSASYQKPGAIFKIPADYACLHDVGKAVHPDYEIET